jgi:hypothetical protein
MLKYDMAGVTDPQKTPLPGVASLLCDITAVMEVSLLHPRLAMCLGFQHICHNILSGQPSLDV